MVNLSPRVKFILITIDELLLVPILIVAAYYLIPELLPFTVVVSIVGAIIFVAIKYHLVYDSLKESSYYFYELQGTRCKVIETVTSTSGKIKLGAEIWEARSHNGDIPLGAEAVIISRESMRVHVKPWHGEDN